MIVKMRKDRTVSTDGFTSIPLKRGQMYEVSEDIGRSLLNAGSADEIKPDETEPTVDAVLITDPEPAVATPQPETMTTNTFEPKTPPPPVTQTKAGSRKPVSPKADAKAAGKA